MCDLFSANVLAAAVTMHRENLMPYSLAWQIQAVPEKTVIRGILLRAFAGSIGKHRRKIRHLYRVVWPDFRVRVMSMTPTANASHLCMRRKWRVSRLVTVTGDPLHDAIAFWKLIPPFCSDKLDLEFDHIDMLSRLSAPPAPVDNDEATEAPVLSPGAVSLLRDAVSGTTSDFQAAIRSGGSDVASLKDFLGHRSVRKSKAWQETFGAQPPRGTLARLARRARVQLHAAHHAHRYKRKHDFVDEMRCMKS